MQIWPLSKLEEVQPHEVIEVRLQQLVATQVEAVIKFGELEDDLDNLGLASTAQAAVVLSPKNSLDALVNHLRADRVFCQVPLRLEVRVLLRHNENGFEVLGLLGLGGLHDGALDVRPDVRGVIPVQVNDRFVLGTSLGWTIALE